TLAADSYLGREPTQLWDAATGKQIATLGDKPFWTTAMAFAPDGQTLAIATLKHLQLWDVAGRKLRHRIKGAGHTVAFAPDSKSIATAGQMLERWDVATGTALYADTRDLGHIGSVTPVAFAPDGRSLASTGGDDTVRVWDLA